VFSVSIDPQNSSLVVSGGEDDKAYVWKMADGQIAFNCTGKIHEVLYNQHALFNIYKPS
jgi:hypothetical protein